MTTFLLTLFVVICILLIVVVLLQKGRGGGLGGAFGGGMTSSAFGTRTGDVFTWVTIVLTSLFLLLAVVNTLVFRPKEIPLYPEFFPPGGAIQSETAVEIRVPGAPKQSQFTIHYTLDEMDPTENSPTYLKEPVRVKPGQTLKARVYRGGRPGPIVEAVYTLPAPTTEIAEAPPTSGPATSSAPSSGPAGVHDANALVKPASAPSSEPAARPETPRATTRPALPAASSAATTNPAT